jgi:hypothetical protein
VTIGEWLTARAPRPPAALRSRIDAVLGESLALDASETSDVCLRAGEGLVEALLRTNSTTRESALDLLTADALVTYAFEAASEAPADLAARAASAMTRIVALGATQPAGVTA